MVSCFGTHSSSCLQTCGLTTSGSEQLLRVYMYIYILLLCPIQQQPKFTEIRPDPPYRWPQGEWKRTRAKWDGGTREVINTLSRTAHSCRCSAPTWWRHGHCSSALAQTPSGSVPWSQMGQTAPEKDATTESHTTHTTNCWTNRQLFHNFGT